MKNYFDKLALALLVSPNCKINKTLNGFTINENNSYVYFITDDVSDVFDVMSLMQRIKDGNIKIKNVFMGVGDVLDCIFPIKQGIVEGGENND